MMPPSFRNGSISGVGSGSSSGQFGISGGCGNVSWYRKTLLCRYITSPLMNRRAPSAGASAPQRVRPPTTVAVVTSPQGRVRPQDVVVDKAAEGFGIGDGVLVDPHRLRRTLNRLHREAEHAEA